MVSFITRAVLLCSFISYSQDVLIKSNGETLNVIISEILNEEIKYKMYNELDGIVYSVKKNDVTLVVFENGTYKPKKNSSQNHETKIDELQQIIITYINKFATNKNELHNFQASIEGPILKLSRVIRSGEKNPKFTLYDLSANCYFHDLSRRKQGLAYINIDVPKIKNGKTVPTEKLVLKIRGHDNAEILLNALIQYHKTLSQTF
ncbi:MAG: hypothetical protein H6584_00905 [Flavobacteriales bacterium]|nr:hypothetical protein [Flavobacteriales bacterium]